MNKKQNKYNEPLTYAPLIFSENYKDAIKMLGNDAEEAISIVTRGLPPKSQSIKDFQQMYKDHNMLVRDANLFLFGAAIIKRWNQSKQVFKFDDTFARELYDTENLIFAKNLWDYLPFNTFYIDLSMCQEILKKYGFNDVDGFFVSVDKNITENCYHLNMVTSIKNGHNGYSRTITIINDTIRDSFLNVSKQDTLSRTNDGYVINMVVQMLNYLSTPKADIKLDYETKKNYKPRHEGAKPRNHISEVQKWDVGYRLGAEFRKWDKGVKEAIESHSKGTGTGISIKPHIRRAHLHLYWVGPKNSPERHLEAIWIKETPVGFKYDIDTDNLNELPATIRKVVSKETKSNKKEKGDIER